MKKLILTLSCLAVVSLAFADDLKVKGLIRPDPLRGQGNYLIINKSGNERGMIRPDPIRSGSNRYLILDKKGNESGIIKPDPLRGQGHWIIETKK